MYLTSATYVNWQSSVSSTELLFVDIDLTFVAIYFTSAIKEKKEKEWINTKSRERDNNSKCI